jgi:hypothetical protein
MEQQLPRNRQTQKPRHAGHLIRAFAQNRGTMRDGAPEARQEEAWAMPAADSNDAEARKQT